MTPEALKQAAKAHNAQIRKEIKILQSGVTEKPQPKNFYKKLQKKLDEFEKQTAK